MLDIAQPQLNRAEWRAVSEALVEARGCGCAAAPGSVADRAAKLLAAVTRRVPARAAPSPRTAAISDFICATRRSRRITEDRVTALIDAGYNRAQIDAIALLAA